MQARVMTCGIEVVDVAWYDHLSNTIGSCGKLEGRPNADVLGARVQD